MKRRSAIRDIFEYFIYYKVFELFISVIILMAVYHYFPKPFNFIYNIIQQIM